MERSSLSQVAIDIYHPSYLLVRLKFTTYSQGMDIKEHEICLILNFRVLPGCCGVKFTICLFFESFCSQAPVYAPGYNLIFTVLFVFAAYIRLKFGFGRECRGKNMSRFNRPLFYRSCY